MWAGSMVVGAAWVSVVVHEADEDMVPCVGSLDWWPASLGGVCWFVRMMVGAGDLTSEAIWQAT